MSSFLLNQVSGWGFSYLVPLFSKETINKVYKVYDSETASYVDRTALQVALIYKNYKTAAKLIDCGADPFKETSICSPIDLILYYDAIECMPKSKLEIIDTGLHKVFSQKGQSWPSLSLDEKRKKEVKAFKRLYALRKKAFNILSLKGTATFRGYEIKKGGMYSSLSMQEQQFESYKKYLNEIEYKSVEEMTEDQAIDFLSKVNLLHYDQERTPDIISAAVTNINNEGLQGIPTGYSTHAFQFVFWKGYLALCNSYHIPIDSTGIRRLDVYKINPQKMSDEILRDIRDLHKMGKEDCNKKIKEILQTLEADKDPLCGLFNYREIQNKKQTSGNCTVKSGNVALRFVQIMQVLSKDNLLSNPTPTDPRVSELLLYSVKENKRFSIFRKLDVLHEISKKGQLSYEDKEWFCEALTKRLNKWALMCKNNQFLHSAENERILDLLDFAKNTFDFKYDISKYSKATEKLEILIQERHQTEAYASYLKEIKEVNDITVTIEDLESCDYLNKVFRHKNFEELKKAVTRINKGKLEGISTGYRNKDKDHSSQIVFFKGYCALCTFTEEIKQLDVYKIKPELVTEQILIDILKLKEKNKTDSIRGLQKIMADIHAEIDPLCEQFDNILSQHQQSNSTDVAMLFIKIMQLLSKNAPLKNASEELANSFTSDEMKDCIVENLKQSEYRNNYLQNSIKKG
ncbi:MAG TPA: hypothetical protein VLG49_03930 [Rhabdochlamydiaceae bacterium]|nr:hypothetical protein [Rhabdochlamydiaceae bacterium]